MVMPGGSTAQGADFVLPVTCGLAVASMTSLSGGWRSHLLSCDHSTNASYPMSTPDFCFCSSHTPEDE